MGDKIIICNKEFVLDEIGYYIGKMNVWEKETDIFLEIKANEKDVDDIVFVLSQNICHKLDLK